MIGQLWWSLVDHLNSIRKIQSSWLKFSMLAAQMENNPTLQTTGTGGSDITLPFVLDLSQQGKLYLSLSFSRASIEHIGLRFIFLFIKHIVGRKRPDAQSPFPLPIQSTIPASTPPVPRPFFLCCTMADVPSQTVDSGDFDHIILGIGSTAVTKNSTAKSSAQRPS